MQRGGALIERYGLGNEYANLVIDVLTKLDDREYRAYVDFMRGRNDSLMLGFAVAWLVDRRRIRMCPTCLGIYLADRQCPNCREGTGD